MLILKQGLKDVQIDYKLYKRIHLQKCMKIQRTANFFFLEMQEHIWYELLLLPFCLLTHIFS